METNSTHILIDKKLQGTLSAEEQFAFEEKLSDKAFKESYLWHLDVSKALAHQEKSTLKARLQKLEKPEVEKKPSYTSFLSIAASIVILLGVSSVWYAHQNFSNTALTNDFYSTPNLSAARGQSTDAAQIQEAYQYFIAEDYLQAIELLQQNKSVSTEQSELLLGYAFFKTNQLNLAATSFKSLENSKEIAKDEAKYMLALAFLKQQKIEESRVILNKLAEDTSSPYQTSAKALLKKLGSPWRSFIFFD